MKTILIGILLVSIFFSGCIEIDEYTKINTDLSGTITNNITMPMFVYNDIKKEIPIECTHIIKGNYVFLTCTKNYTNLNTRENTTITINNNTIIYDYDHRGTTRDYDDKMMEKCVTLTYIIEMPYPITTSNANNVTKNIAIWYYDRTTPPILHVESKIPIHSIPGLNIIMIFGIIFSIFILKKHKP